VNIIVDEARDVLIVPSRAVTSRGRDIIVQVLEGEETVPRVIETGLSDSSNTEVISGLEEGEQVIVHSSTSTTFNSDNGGGGLMGIGGAMGDGVPRGMRP